ncbi:MAG: hypothetical protein K1060chlam2_01128, partial [Chlamydiae bacterium]|nr:hypothetical protein [Chlamydiota bacterium]
FAQIGATLEGEEGKRIKIKRSKLRDIESFGMLCSKRELGLSDDDETIAHLADDATAGTDLKELFGDTIIELSLTPNLGHCMSMLGIARELAALLDQKVIRSQPELKEGCEKIPTVVEIKDGEKCSHYSCRLIRNVKVGPSPDWLRARLENAGVRSINNVVDATNYAMLELGQPLHAFDYSKISGGKIVVQEAESELTFESLDGVKRTIPAGVLMIYDAERPIAVAGVIGGANSEVQEGTSEVLLEAAHFDPSTVRKSSKLLSIRSESSARFERGVDYKMMRRALDLAASLIEGDLAAGRVDIEARPIKERRINVRTSRVNQILGTELSQSEIESFLERLEMKVDSIDGTVEVTIPSYRNDIHYEIDLIEEVARIYGYNSIKKREARVVNSSLPHAPIYLLENRVRRQLIGAGLQEFLTCDLISPELAELSLEKSLGEQEEIRVLQPSSVDQSILRSSLLPGMVQAVKYNFDRKNFDISAFEMGRVHFKDGEKYKERATAALLLTGKKRPHHWGVKPLEVDFFDLKGIIENVLEPFQLKELTFKSSSLESFHPGKQAQFYVNDVCLGALGEVHPSRLRLLDIEERVVFAQFDLHDLLEVKGGEKQMTPLPQFPGSERDWTITLKAEVALAQLFEAIDSLPSKLLKEWSLLDLYESEKLGSERKNVTFRFLYRNDRQTVEQPQVDREHERLISEITKKIRDFIC